MITVDTLDPIYMVLILMALTLLPFVAIMVTSFVKLSVVISLLRNALGLQQVPPNMVINGLAMILTVYIMMPVGQDMSAILLKAVEENNEFKVILQSAIVAKEPLRGFLLKHSQKNERMFFVNTTKTLWKNEDAENLKEDNLMVLIPSFTVCELTKAFKIGFLIYLPFIIIDLIVSNILMAMGMAMVSPTTISLPFKLLMFVLVDGWAKLIHGLVLTYR